MGSGPRPVPRLLLLELTIPRGVMRSNRFETNHALQRASRQLLNQQLSQIHIRRIHSGTRLVPIAMRIPPFPA